jgi:regulator of protease activity HflC (stomatin/prohibitin superfamily)
VVERGEDKGATGVVGRQDENGAERDDGAHRDELGEPAPLGAPDPIVVGRARRAGRERWRPRGPRSAWWLVLIPVVLVGLALAPTFLSGLKKTPRDRVGISYGGGPFEGVHFQRIVEPGSNLFFNGFFDTLYLYPSDQVNYIVSDQQGREAQATDAVVAPTRDRVQASYQVAVYFKLNTDELQDFHEQLGLRYEAYTTGGWNDLINDTFRQQIENALQEETRKVDVADLVGNADLLVDLQDNVQSKLTQRLEDALGRQFFCAPTFGPGGDCGDPTFVIKKVDIPTSVAKAFEDVRTSDIQIQTKENEVLQREAEARAIAALGLTGQEYDILKAIESGRITFWVLPGDSGVTITGPDTGTGTGAQRGSTTTTTREGRSGG